MNAVGRGWRVFATGLAFAVFGGVTLLLSFSLFPLLALTAPDRDRGQRRVQRAVHYGCRWFLWLIRSLGILSCELHGREHLRPPGRLIIANHPSLIDVVFLFAWLPQMDCIIKQELLDNPFLKWSVAWAGYIGNARPERLIESCAASLRAGRTLVVFPEGTRSVPGRRLPFQRGAARIALETGVAVVPVQIRCEPVMLTKGAKWWQVPARASHFSFVAGAPLHADRFRRPGEPPAQAARRLTRQFELLLGTEPRTAAAALQAYSLPS